jgi:hypothetical protein
MARVNKQCPFCKILLRKERASFSKQIKIFCFKCKNKFTEIDNIISFDYNTFKVIITNKAIKIIDNNNEYTLLGKFDVYNNFKEVKDKLQIMIFK